MELRKEAPRKEHNGFMDQNETSGTNADTRPAGGFSYKPVAAILFGIVLVILGAAFLLNSRLRPPTTVEAPATVAANAALPATSTPLAVASPTSIALPGIGPLSTSTPVSSPTASSVQLPPGVHVASSPEEREIEQAYLKYWQVYSDAVLNLDTSHLHEVLAGPALQWVTDEVNGLKAQGRPVKIDVQHAYGFSRVTATSATVVDQYVSQSVYIDPTTRQPLPRTGSPSHVLQSFDFEKIDGTWKVVGGTRQALGESGQ